MSSGEINDDDFVVEPYICTALSPDEVRHEPGWIVRLSDGITVYSKHGRRSWLELKQYLSDNRNKWIVGLTFRFRDHCIDIHHGPADYFFAHGADGWLDGPTYNFYLGGIRVEDKVCVHKYHVPALEPAEPFMTWRTLNDKTVAKGLIVSNKPQCGFKELDNG